LRGELSTKDKSSTGEGELPMLNFVGGDFLSPLGVALLGVGVVRVGIGGTSLATFR